MKTKYKGIASVLLFAAVIVLLIGVTNAVFTYQANKKGVISTEAIDTYFSSNYLKLCANEEDLTNNAESFDFAKYEGQTLVFDGNGDGNGDTVSFDFTVKNYLIAGKNNPGTIDYQLTFVLKAIGEGNPSYGTLGSYSVQKTKPTLAGTATSLFPNTSKVWNSGESYYTLSETGTDLYQFQVTIPKDALDHVQLLIIAKPTEGSLTYTNSKMLAAVFSPCTESNVRGFALSHRFTDTSITKVSSPSDLDAFNYEVSINTGSAWVTLTWDTRYVEIDPFFKDRVTMKPASGNIYTTSENMKSLTFKMDTAEAGSCLVQFYRTAARSDTETWQSSWDEMKKVITSSAVQITETQGAQ